MTKKGTRFNVGGKECNFEMLCNRLGKRHTYKIKTYLGDHTCPKIFNNRSVTSKRVVGKMVDRMRGSKKLRMVDIIDEVKIGYSTGITKWRAWCARKIASQVVEGDASRQYNQL